MTFWCRSRSCYLRHWPSRRQPKNNFFNKFFCLLLFEGIYIIFRIRIEKVQKYPDPTDPDPQPGFFDFRFPVPSPEAEFMNAQFRWGFWKKSGHKLESSHDLKFPNTKFTLHYKPVLNYYPYCSKGGGGRDKLLEVTLNKNFKFFFPIYSNKSATV